MSIKLTRICVIIGIIGLWSFVFQGADLVRAKDPDYPIKPITLIIPYTAGGTTDVIIRPLCEAAGKILGQPIVVLNKPGGGTITGSVAVMNAKPDGYTIGTTSGTQALVVPHIEESPYKDLRSFAFICNYGDFTHPVVIKSDAPYKSWKEFIGYARQHPGEIKVGLVGSRSRSPQGMVFWDVEQKEGVKFGYIVFKSGQESLNAVLGGHIPVDATAVSSTLVEFLEQGKLRIIAYMGMPKVSGYDAPTFKEMYGTVIPSIAGIWGPAGIPKDILDKLDKAFAQGTKDPKFVEVMNRMYMPILYRDRVELERHVMELYPRVGKMLKILKEEEPKTR